MDVANFQIGQRLDKDLLGGQRFVESGGAISISDRIMILNLSDYRSGDANQFEGVASLRIAKLNTFMIISLAFKSFSFDLIWSPDIALKSNEKMMEAPEENSREVYSFILIDGQAIIRSIRVASISFNVSNSIYRAQREIMSGPWSEKDFLIELMGVFSTYPGGIPENFFHETCNLGD